MKRIFLILSVILFSLTSRAASILIPMDETQTNHLKAYGIVWHVLDHNTDVQWLLNYRGGSYLFDYNKDDEQLLLEKGVKFETLPDVMAASVLKEVNAGENNTAAVEMQRSPKIAVYAPTLPEVWDDAVMNVLLYADIPFDVLYDKEVLQGNLTQYDWLHLHHEDFTGQHGRFFTSYANEQWYKDEVAADEKCASENGFKKVADMKLAVALKMKMFASNGGFLFAMCNATETFDIALAANGTDITSFVIDGDPYDPEFASKLNFNNCLAFQNFTIYPNGGFRMSNINTYSTRMQRGVNEQNDKFVLSSFDVRTQQAQSMLVQNHVATIKGFWGATTGFDKAYIRNDVDVLADNALAREARYIHGNIGKGMWTFYSGHDPEDYQHRVGDATTDINAFPNSPGYRLILNNVLFQSTRTVDETHSAFSAYPNPASAMLNVNYTLAEDATGVLNIYDATGKLSSSVSLEAGSTTTSVDVSAFSEGNYLWQIESGKKVLYSDKFSVVR